jgi:hypothetical protein
MCKVQKALDFTVKSNALNRNSTVCIEFETCLGIVHFNQKTTSCMAFCPLGTMLCGCGEQRHSDLFWES